MVRSFLFTDVESSTRLLHELGDRRGARVLEAQAVALGAVFAAHDGVVFGTGGDSVFAAFVEPESAVAAGLDGQRLLRASPWGDVVVSARMALHTGAAVRSGSNYFGLAVHTAARICRLAAGGQILVSAATRTLVDSVPAGAGFRDLGECQLKGFAGSTRLFELTHPELDSRAEQPRAPLWSRSSA